MVKLEDSKEKIVVEDDGTTTYEEEDNTKEASNIKEALRWLRKKKKEK